MSDNKKVKLIVIYISELNVCYRYRKVFYPSV